MSVLMLTLQSIVLLFSFAVVSFLLSPFHTSLWELLTCGCSGFGNDWCMSRPALKTCSDDSMEKLTNTHTGKQHTTTSTQAFMQDCNGQKLWFSAVLFYS